MFHILQTVTLKRQDEVKIKTLINEELNVIATKTTRSHFIRCSIIKILLHLQFNVPATEDTSYFKAKCVKLLRLSNYVTYLTWKSNMSVCCKATSLVIMSPTTYI